MTDKDCDSKLKESISFSILSSVDLLVFAFIGVYLTFSIWLSVDVILEVSEIVLDKPGSWRSGSTIVYAPLSFLDSFEVI